jgi:O-antigen ligase
MSGLVWLLLRHPHQRIRNLLVAIALFFLLALTQLHNPKITNWFTVPERSSLASRITIWNVSLRMIQNHPLVGIGAGNFQDIYLDYQAFFPPYLEWAVPEPHNLFLAFWLESGLFGLIGFSLISIFLFSTIQSPKNQRDSLASLLWMYSVSLLIQGLFDTPFWSLPLAYSFWFVLFLALILTTTSPDTESDSSDR